MTRRPCPPPVTGAVDSVPGYLYKRNRPVKAALNPKEIPDIRPFQPNSPLTAVYESYTNKGNEANRTAGDFRRRPLERKE